MPPLMADESAASEPQSPSGQAATPDQLEALRRRFEEGGAVPISEASPPTVHAGPGLTLPEIARRCRLKAEAARLAARRQSEGPSNTLAQAKRHLRARAGALGVPLWPLGVSAPRAEAQTYEALGACFDTAATAANLLAAFERANRRPDADASYRTAFALAAEAQSALRTAYLHLYDHDPATPSARDEPEQLALFLWLREATERYRVYVPRHLRADDPADPARAPVLRRQLRLLGRRAGLPGFTRPSHKRAPTPETEAEPPEPDRRDSYSDDVQAVADFLRGQVVVLVGGTRYPHKARALREALGLTELRWLRSREHQSTAPFETAIARPKVKLVLVAIRFSSHSFAEDLQTYCARHDKPLVLLPAGLGINRVAHEILRQAGDRLRADDPTP